MVVGVEATLVESSCEEEDDEEEESEVVVGAWVDGAEVAWVGSTAAELFAGLRLTRFMRATAESSWEDSDSGREAP